MKTDKQVGRTATTERYSQHRLTDTGWMACLARTTRDPHHFANRPLSCRWFVVALYLKQEGVVQGFTIERVPEEPCHRR